MPLHAIALLRGGVDIRQPRPPMLAQADERMAATGNDDRLMRQLTSLDAQFLAMENDRTPGHVSVLGVYRPAHRVGTTAGCGAGS